MRGMRPTKIATRYSHQIGGYCFVSGAAGRKLNTSVPPRCLSDVLQAYLHYVTLLPCSDSCVYLSPYWKLKDDPSLSITL